MFTYLLLSLRSRWFVYLLIWAILIVLGAGFGGSQAIREEIIIHAQKDLQEHWRWQYDILVYPKESQSYQGLGDGWVAPQTSIASYGGMSLDDLETIRQIPGVEVAAPVSLLGYFEYGLLLALYENADPNQFYKIDYEQTAFDGLRDIRIKNWTRYSEYIAPELTTPQQLLDHNKHYSDINVKKAMVPPNEVFRYPNQIMLVAVDPVAEEKLYGLSKSVTEGEDLTTATISTMTSSDGVKEPIIPFIALRDQGYQVEESIEVSRIDLSDQVDPWSLEIEDIIPFLEGQANTTLAQLHINPYDSIMRYKHSRLIIDQSGFVDEGSGFLTTTYDLVRYSPIQYTLIEHSENTIPTLHAEGKEAYKNPHFGEQDTFYTFREEAELHGIPNFMMNAIGFYDTSLIKPQYTSAWQEGDPIDLYTPQHSKILADGVGNPVDPTPLIPLPMKDTYYTGAPDALTTLDAAEIFYGTEPPLSSIRVAVEGVEERSEASQKKIEQVAMQIMEQTGHQVEIMLGSSAGKVHIQLGGAGEGEVGLVEEGWQQKGVSWSIEEQISLANQWLFFYLVVIIFVLSYTVITHSLLKRSTEFSMLRAIGWSRSQIVRVLIVEIALLALIPLIPTFFIMQQWNEGYNWGQASILLIINLLIIAVGYYSGSHKSLSHAPRAGLAGEGDTSGTKRLYPISGLWGYILHQLFRRPLRFGLILLSLVLSTMMVLLFVATQQSLSDFLFLSVLGEVVDLNLQPYQIMFLSLGIVFTVSVVIMLLFLNLIERRKEFYLMRSIGWSNQKITSYLLVETGVIGLLGGLIGTILGYALLTYFSSLWLPTWIAGIAVVAPFVLLLVFIWILYHFIGISRLKPKLDS